MSEELKARVMSKVNGKKTSQEPEKIRAMFGSIAGRYDVLNRVMSARLDVGWRRRTARQAIEPGDTKFLDVACGTGDLTLDLAAAAGEGAQVIGLDFTPEMLRLAKDKQPSISWVEGDGMNLPFPDDTFDVLTIGFGLRNMISYEGGLREMRRVLRPGGRLAVLECSHPEGLFMRTVYMPYFKHILPRIGATLSRQSAYKYLQESVLEFPDRRELAAMMSDCGFSEVRHEPLTFGAVALHIGRK